MQQLFATCEAALGGRLAVAIIESTGQLAVSYNADLLLPSASLIKVPLAWQWLALPPQPAYTVRASDISDPDGALIGEIGHTIERFAIARVMITESENNATNLVLDWVGGLAAANAWLAARGWTATRWGRRMADWAARAAGHENVTSAGEMAAILAALRADPGNASVVLRSWLSAAVDDQKIDAGLPPGVPLAHKVGDLPGMEHDAGIVTRPSGSWYSLAVLTQGSAPVAVLRAQIATIARWYWRATRDL